MEQLKGIVQYYNQHGEGVVFYNEKPVYIYGVIKNEEVTFRIIKIFKNYYVGELIKILKPSPNRYYHDIQDAQLIGGYDLIHMKYEEQRKFKIEKVISDFKKIANTIIDEFDWIEGEKKIKYRNKITLHDGYFYQKNSNQIINIDDFLLSSIQWDKSLKGEIIYRQLDTLIFGNKKELKYTYDSMLGYKFRVGLNSFYQINKEVALLAYKYIQNNLNNENIVLDLYSGIGTIGIIASSKAKKVIGVEINVDSYKDAIFNKTLNNIKNIQFYNSDVHKFLQNNTEKIDVIIVDPPRSGLNKKTLDLINNKLKPKKIIYMSCNPATQAANFNILKSNYNLSQIAIMDMFPQTYHIETIIILESKN